MMQRTFRMAVPPLGAAAVTATTSTLLGGGCRQSTARTSQKANQVASQHLSALVRKIHIDARNKINTRSTSTHTHINNITTRLQNSRRYFADLSKEIPKKETSTVESATAQASKSKSKSNGSGTFVQWYEANLESRPIATKAITGSILWGLGDIVAQVVPTLFFQDDDDVSSASSAASVVPKKEFQYDYPRTARAMFFGFGIHAPLSHVHFNFLEWMTVRAGFQGMSVPVFKTVMEQVSIIKLCRKGIVSFHRTYQIHLSCGFSFSLSHTHTPFCLKN